MLTSRSAEENNAICLGCHQRGDRTYWDGSTHETRGLQCSNCHTVMRNVSLKHNTKTAWEPETCFQCHGPNMWSRQRQDRRAWESTLYRMVGRGALWTEDEIRQMADYLGNAYGKNAK